MILLADAHRHADQAEASIALVHHTAPVAVVLPIDVSVDDGLRSPTVSSKAADFRATPEPIGHALTHPGAHQRISGIAGEDGCCPVDRQCSDAVAIGGNWELSTGDDLAGGRRVPETPFAIGLTADDPLASIVVARVTDEHQLGLELILCLKDKPPSAMLHADATDIRTGHRDTLWGDIVVAP